MSLESISLDLVKTDISPITPLPSKNDPVIESTTDVDSTLGEKASINIDSKNDDSEAIKQSLKFLRNETLKMFLKVYQVKHECIKFYFVFIIIFAASISSYMLAILIINYLSFEVVTTTRSIAEATSVFPKVTLCNRNMFQSEYALNFLKEINREMFPHIDMFDADKFESNLNDNFIMLYAWQIYNRSLSIIHTNFTDEQQKRLAHDSNDLIFNRHFGFETSLSRFDYFWYFDRIYGNCYVFNSGFDMSGKNRVNLKTTNVPGPNGGLSLDYYVGFHQNLTLFNALSSGILEKISAGAQGAVIRIENNTFFTDASFTENDIHVVPGMQVSIKIHRSFEYSMPKPYSNCDISNEDAYQVDFIRTNYLYRLFATNALYQYTRQACLIQCYQQRIIQNCSCTDRRYMSLFSENISICLNEKQYSCKLTFEQGWQWDDCLNVCPLECNKTVYAIEMQSLQLFGEYYLKIITKFSNDFLSAKNVTKDEALKSFARLQIYYNTLTHTVTTEVAKMNLVDLIASIGGNLSLFLGLSMFSLCEIVEILMEIYFIKKKTCNF
jgi:hypothetical protein